MFENRSLKLDLCALVLLAGVAFLGVSLWSYDRFDPPSTLVDPPSQSVHNACGVAGAYTANFLFESMGYGAYYLFGSLAALTGMLLLRREIDQPMLRAVGWIVSLVGLTTLAALVVPNWTPGPMIGSGGYVGAMGRAYLEMHFAKAGAFILTLSVLAAGLLLATDYFLLRAAAATTSFSGRSLAHLGHFGKSAAKRSNRVKTDLDENEIAEALEDEEEEDNKRQIRIRTPADKAGEAAAARGRRGRNRRGRGRIRRGGIGRCHRSQRFGQGLEVCQRAEGGAGDQESPPAVGRSEGRAGGVIATARGGRPAGRPRNRLRNAAARLAAAQRRDLLRGAREGSPPQGEDSRKDVQELRLQRAAWSRSRPAP